MVSRREFVKRLVSTAATVPLLMAFPQVASAEEAKTEPKKPEAIEPPELPWPYTKLDPEETRKLGHMGYYLFECAGAAFWSIAIQLREKIGYPWTLLPIPSREKALDAIKNKKHLHSLFQYGYGGAVGWGTLCGALNGSLFAIQMIVGEHKAWDKLGKALMRIYETTPLPTRKSNEYAVKGMMYVPPERMKSKKWLPQNVSGSTLCHVSVGKWCEVSGYASGSPERSERCGRLTGDIAAFAVMLLNNYFDALNRVGNPSKAADIAVAEVTRIVKSEYSGDVRLSATTASCRTCHFKGKLYEDGQFTRGFLACESCHRDMRPHAHTFFEPSEALPVREAKTANERKLEGALATGSVASAAIGAIAGFAAAKASGGGGRPNEKEEREHGEGQ
ncbi:hypothetical protein EYM_05540 [Ignicoccus islandicus DSM 13165]|uniref:Split-Soret cytochrome c n=1 Tax=Ignicoccus islandicus DSM 13165 TaxID=940295 RepID=A0A0U2VF35_9CREN|nr:C-GCAxxG-C-C family protein [Ignicoccus islandicus]ALU12594.1 hypothetical protein EYM_05540 [Ignicoccus islandicus DSM 13165]